MTETRPRRRRRGFTDDQVAALPRKAARYVKADPEMRGLYLRVPVRGPVVFAAVARDPSGKQVWTTLGSAGMLRIEEARDLARAAIKRMQAGEPGIAPPKPVPESVETVARNWLERVVNKNEFRTAVPIRRLVENFILTYAPWKGRTFISIRRSEIAAFLDHIEDRHSQHMADQILGVLRSMAGWVAERDDSYVLPFTRKMGRVPKEDRARSRVLSDAEIRRVWLAADDAGDFGRLVQLLLLTAQRRGKVLSMRWSDIAADGTWTIPAAKREKNTGGALRLAPLALDIIRTMPRFAGVAYVFLHRAISYGRLKGALDEASGVTDWKLHDLRRTARTLMSRSHVGVPGHVAELVLGHAISGIEATYNRHSYVDEKADALQRLAAEIARIVNLPEPADNVTRLRKVASS